MIYISNPENKKEVSARSLCQLQLGEREKALIDMDGIIKKYPKEIAGELKITSCLGQKKPTILTI